MKRIIFIGVILIVLSPLCAYGLGDGCRQGVDTVACEKGCWFECSGNLLVKKCNKEFGWCASQNGVCVECDERTTAPRDCGTIDCTRFNGFVEDTQSCFGTILMQNYAQYVCDTGTKTCKPAVDNRQKENPSSECCPINGETTPPGGEYTMEGLLVYTGAYPSHTTPIPDTYTALADSGGMMARITIKFPSLNDLGITPEIEQLHTSGKVKQPIMLITRKAKIEAVNSAGTMLSTIGTYANDEPLLRDQKTTKEYNNIQLPSGTRGIKITNMWCGYGACFGPIETTTTLKCTCAPAAWVFDKDHDGYYSYKANNDFQGAVLTECTNPAQITNFCESTFPGYVAECKQRENWIIEKSSATAKKECGDSAASTYLTSQECRTADDNSAETPETTYCADTDNDGYGTACQTKNALGFNTYGKKALYNLLGASDCDDNNQAINNYKTWALDKDNDGYWSMKAEQCTAPNNYWKEITPETATYDCDDSSDIITNPLGCNCRTEGAVITKNNKQYLCYGTSGEITKSPGVFEIVSENTGKKWAEMEEGQNCPKNMCELNSKCVSPGTYWSKDGTQNKGNEYCAQDKEGAYLSKRTTKIANFLIRTGERTGKDFTVYCDNFDKISQTYEITEKSQNPATSIKNALNVLMSKENNDVGEGCVLTINDEYTGKIKKDGAFEKQKIVIGLPVIEDKNDYFGTTLGTADSSGWRKNEAKGMYLYKPLNLLLIAESETSTNVYNILKTNINAEITPNSITTNIFEMIRNPFEKVEKALTFTINSENIKQADKIYLGKNNNFYFYTLLKGNELTARIVNIDEDDRQFVYDLCYKGYMGNGFECSPMPEEGKLNFKSMLMKTTITGNTDEVWQKFSRQIRLMDNNWDFPRDSLYQKECSYDWDCAEIPCYTRSCAIFDSVMNIRTCKYEIDNTKRGGDSCCPPEATHAEDSDCPETTQPEPEILQLQSEIADACRYGWTEILKISRETNAHIVTKSGKSVCVKTSQGTLTKTTGPECNSPIITFSGDNTHAGTEYNEKVCLALQLDGYELSCKTDRQDSSFTPILSLTALTNAHAGTPDTYPIKLQCKAVKTISGAIGAGTGAGGSSMPS